VAAPPSRRAAARHARPAPHRVLALTPAKVYHLYRDDQGARSWIRHGLARRFSPTAERWLFRIVDGYYFAVLGLALVGARRFLPRDGRGAVAVPLTVAWVTAVHAVFFFGSARLHVPLVPVLPLMAAAEVVAAARWLRWPAQPRTA
jgi:hypothetical protein